MKSRLYFSFLALFSFASVLSADIYFGTAQGVIQESKERASKEELQKLVRDTFAEAQKELKGKKASFMILQENFGSHYGFNSILKDLREEHQIRATGVSTGGYYPLGIKKFPEEHNSKSLNILLIGGDVDIETHTVNNVEQKIKNWEIAKHVKKEILKEKPDLKGEELEAEVLKQEEALVEKYRQDHIGWGKELAKKFSVPEKKTNLMLVLGSLHTPRHKHTVEGVRSVLSESVKYWGVAGADFATVYQEDGKQKKDTALGILISGDFDIKYYGAHQKDKEQQVSDLQTLSENMKKEDLASAKLAMMAICNSWNNNIEKKFGIVKDTFTSVPLWGAFAGGEIGHMQTGEKEPVANSSLCIFALIQ